METAIQIFVGFLGVYSAIGILFSIYFFVKGAAQMDELIVQSKWKVRILLIPGAIGLWPVLLGKLIHKIRSKS